MKRRFWTVVYAIGFVARLLWSASVRPLPGENTRIRDRNLVELVMLWIRVRTMGRMVAEHDVYDAIKVVATAYDFDPQLVYIFGREAPGTEPTIGKEHD